MQRKLDKILRSDYELVKEAGLVLDYDEIARKGSMTREEFLIAKLLGRKNAKKIGMKLLKK